MARMKPLFYTSTHSLFKRTEDEYIPDAESVRQVKEQHQQPQTCSLAQCFQLYTKEEQVNASHACINLRLLIYLLLCANFKCQSLVIFAIDDSSLLRMTPGAVRTVSSFSRAASSSVCGHCQTSSYCTWNASDRYYCRESLAGTAHHGTSSCYMSQLQDGDRRMKIQNMVKFPLIGMDMAPHMVKRSQSSWSLPSHWSPWRRPYGMSRDPEDYLYDLYAVCNHHGTMQGGHYTGNCIGTPWTACLLLIDWFNHGYVLFHSSL